MPRSRPKRRTARFAAVALTAHELGVLLAPLLDRNRSSATALRLVCEVRHWISLVAAAGRGGLRDEPSVREVTAQRGSRGRPQNVAQADAIVALRRIWRTYAIDGVARDDEGEFSFVLRALSTSAAGWKAKLDEPERRKELRRLFRDHRFEPPTLELIAKRVSGARSGEG